MMLIRVVGIAMLAALVTAGCASTSSSGPGSRSDVITAEEVASVGASNLYQVVEQLRPRWLEVRAQQSFSAPTQIVVYQGSTRLGGLEMLRQLSPDMVEMIRYLDGPTASASLSGIGGRQVAGAIVVNP